MKSTLLETPYIWFQRPQASLFVDGHCLDCLNVATANAPKEQQAPF